VRTLIVSAIWFAACTSPSQSVGVDPDEAHGPDDKADGVTPVPDVRCTGEPDAGPAGDFRHFGGSVVSLLGSPRHRGIDVIASANATEQTIGGAISYTVADKALEDEDVDLFACRAGQWKHIGRARTDDEGWFELVLSGNDRLPIGMRDLYVSVVGDRTGTEFLGYVAPDDARLVVSDVDGTLTSSENAFWGTIALGIQPDAHPGAPEAFQRLVQRGIQVSYVTARGSQYTNETREWLELRGFPRGPLRLAHSFFTLPGDDTVDYKTATLEELSAAVPIIAGIGNRSSDVSAYSNIGLTGDSIMIKLPEFTDEVQALLDLGSATALEKYSDLDALMPQ